jgi:hydrogenase expression/formation protein HypC
MCLAVPLRLVDVRGELGRVSEAGVTRDVSLALVPEAKAGDHVLVHAGFAIQVIDETEAQATLDLLRELGVTAGEPAP